MSRSQPEKKYTPQELTEALRVNPAVDSTIHLTQRLIRIPSVTAIKAEDRAASKAALDILEKAASDSGAAVHRMTFSGDHPKWDYPVENLYIEWVFGKGDKHLCYMGHLDVVPPGDKAAWTEDPFSGEIRDGFIYGRGATDMKGSVAAFFTAVADNLDALKDTDLRIGMIVTMDEEWAAINGSKKVLEWMRGQGMQPDAFIVGEPSSQDTLGTHIKVGRRGSLCGTFDVAGVQGHAAYQELFENPNRALALAVSILNAHKFNDGNENFPNTNFEPVAIASGDFNASAVIPGSAKMLWNVRFTPQQAPDGLEAWIKEQLANPPEWAKNHPDAHLLKNISVTANKDTASKPYYSPPAGLAFAAQGAIKSVLNMAAVMDGSGGATDGRFAAEIYPNAEIIEFGLPERGGQPGGVTPPDYRQKGGMHQVDERAALQDLIHLREIFMQTITNIGRQNHDDKKPDTRHDTSHRPDGP